MPDTKSDPKWVVPATTSEPRCCPSFTPLATTLIVTLPVVLAASVVTTYEGVYVVQVREGGRGAEGCEG